MTTSLRSYPGPGSGDSITALKHPVDGGWLWTPYAVYSTASNLWVATKLGQDVIAGPTYAFGDQFYPVGNPLNLAQGASLTFDTSNDLYTTNAVSSYTPIPEPASTRGHAFDAGGRLWIGTDAGIYYSDDHASFTLSTGLLNAGDTVGAMVACHPTDTNRIAVEMQGATNAYQVYVTTDHGATWLRHSVDGVASEVASHLLLQWTATALIGCFQNNSTGDIHMYRSTNDGATWTLEQTQVAPEPFDVYDICSGGGVVYLAVRGLGSPTAWVWRSIDDGLTWTRKNVSNTAVIMGMNYSGGKLYMLLDDGTFVGVTDPSTTFTIAALASPPSVDTFNRRGLGPIAL